MKLFIKLNKLLRNCYVYQTHCYNSRSHNLVKKPLAENIEKLYEENKQLIYYSSFIENNKIRLRYKLDKIVEGLLEEKEKSDKNVKNDIKPFPLSLKYLNDEKPANENSESLSIRSDSEEMLHFTSTYSDKITQKIKGIIRKSNKSEKIDNNNPQKTFWMHDYEIFDETVQEDNSDNYGTADPLVAVSNIPCYGCGAVLHCADKSLPGYLPSELFKKTPEHLLQTVTCQRCHFLINYNTALNITVSSDEYIKMIESITDKKALAIILVDLLDMPSSIFPGIIEILGPNRPIFIVGNKVDLLPRDSDKYLNHIKYCLERHVIDSGISKANILHTCLISAETGFGIEELLTKLQHLWKSKGDVYLIGCTNVGKSTLFNALLRSDYCKVKASSIIRKATSSIWPGTTLRMLKFPILRPSDERIYLRNKRLQLEKAKLKENEQLRKSLANKTGLVEHATLIGHIGRTFLDGPTELIDSFSMNKGVPQNILNLDENAKEYVKSKWCFDTPGVFHKQQILDLLTTEELLMTIPKEMVRTRTFLLHRGMSIFLAGLGRIDYLDGLDKIRIIVYSSLQLPILITNITYASKIYETFLGTEVLGVPKVSSNPNRLDNWPRLEPSNVFVIDGLVKHISACDIILSSAGWISVNIPDGASGEFQAWTPEKRGIFIRKPSLLPYGMRLRGRRIRSSLAYQTGKPFVKY